MKLTDERTRHFTPNGVVTYGTCPACRMPGIRVEHGRDEDGLPQHFEHCPECGDLMVMVCYDCPHCREALEEIVMKNNPPEQIYLQAHDAEGHLLDATKNEVTWCVDQINENDTVYILATPELAGLLERLAEWADEAVLDGGYCLGEDMGTSSYDGEHNDIAVARALAQRTRKALGQDMLSQAQETPSDATEEK